MHDEGSQIFKIQERQEVVKRKNERVRIKGRNKGAMVSAVDQVLKWRRLRQLENWMPHNQNTS